MGSLKIETIDRLVQCGQLCLKLSHYPLPSPLPSRRPRMGHRAREVGTSPLEACSHSFVELDPERRQACISKQIKGYPPIRMHEGFVVQDKGRPLTREIIEFTIADGFTDAPLC